MTSSWSLSSPLRVRWSCPPADPERADFFSGQRWTIRTETRRGPGSTPRSSYSDGPAPSERCGSPLLVDFSPRRRRVGDILLFRQGGVLVVHRFLGRVRSRRAGPCLRTRGDGRPDLDPPVFDRDVVGRVVAVRRDGGWRTLRGPLPALYARMIAWHDHVWSGAAWLAGKLDRRLPAAFLRRTVARLDHRSLRVADAVLFRLAHRSIPPPSEVATARS